MENCSLLGFPFQCFQLSSSAPKFFGFSEFIAGLALLVLVWTIIDVRYKFRIATAPLPLERSALIATFGVGILTLTTDFWRSNQGWVPAGNLFSPESWQLLLGITFLLVICIWVWFAFVNPATFNRWNATRFAETLDEYIMRGSQQELMVVADELSRSTDSIIRYSVNTESRHAHDNPTCQAIHILDLMASQKFCHAVVAGAPKLIYKIFPAISKYENYQNPIKVFTKNIVNSAIENKTSFLHSETNYYESGKEGFIKPITSVLLQDYKIIDNIGTLLSADDSGKAPWDLKQWQAYFRLLEHAFFTHVNSNSPSLPEAIHWSKLRVSRIYKDLNKNLQLAQLDIDNELYLRLKTLGDLIKNITVCLNECPPEKLMKHQKSIEYVVALIYSLIESASEVRRPRQVSRRIQHEIIWDEILNSRELSGTVGLQIQKKVHDLLFETVLKCPNVDSIRILGYCLNVLGFYVYKDQPFGKYWCEFHTKLLDWTKNNIVDLIEKYPSIARECFVDGMKYDKKRKQLIINHYSHPDGKKYNSYFKLHSNK